MSKYTYYYNTRQNMYRDFATRWANWAAEANLTTKDLEGVSIFFKPIARRFGLIKEFRDIGVL